MWASSQSRQPTAFVSSLIVELRDKHGRKFRKTKLILWRHEFHEFFAYFVVFIEFDPKIRDCKLECVHQTAAGVLHTQWIGQRRPFLSLWWSVNREIEQPISCLCWKRRGHAFSFYHHSIEACAAQHFSLALSPDYCFSLPISIGSWRAIPHLTVSSQSDLPCKTQIDFS